MLHASTLYERTGKRREGGREGGIVHTCRVVKEKRREEMAEVRKKGGE